MKSHRTFRIDKIFGLATLISIIAMAIMIYNDYFKGTVDISGVFGKADGEWSGGEPITVGFKQEVHTGACRIYTTIDESGPSFYDAEISEVDASGRSGKNMVIRITDPALLEKTGGIVQGMSGSPIIQDEKLVGAVTHVLVHDPTTGYGIFIENMMDAAE